MPMNGSSRPASISRAMHKVSTDLVEHEVLQIALAPVMVRMEVEAKQEVALLPRGPCAPVVLFHYNLDPIRQIEVQPEHIQHGGDQRLLKPLYFTFSLLSEDAAALLELPQVSWSGAAALLHGHAE